MNKINDLYLVLVQMLNEEKAQHVDLVNVINKRKPAERERIIEHLTAIHTARIEILEYIVSITKEIKK